MKALFIAYNQSYGDEIIEMLETNGQRGFTRFDGIGGRGGYDGIPHLGSHAWPESNDGILTVVPDDKLETLLAALRGKDALTPELGIRAFAWNIDNVL